jgi:extracellular elastinolytic metalloproteinase
MQDNWYEATVSVMPPYTIVSVVDWASDSALPIPHEPREPATYNVFVWGLNDPSEGDRSIVKEHHDTLASPMGWHSLPYANDPTHNYNGRPYKEFYRNTSTTWGNNVSAISSHSRAQY